MPDLSRLLGPKSVAVFGGRIAASVVNELKKIGFVGDIWPVHPNRTEMSGVACFSSLDHLPAVPDAAYIAVPNEATIEIVSALSAMGSGGAICHASGFSEVGDGGAARTERLLEAAGEMPILGPNCWGVLNLIDRAALWPDFHGCVPVDRGVAIISQSGNMAINFTMQKRGLPIAYVINLGNQAMLDANDCIEAFLDDPRVSAIGIHMEGMRDPSRFSQLAHKAFKSGIPLVVLKSGASEKGARATISHTATLAGPDDLYDALFGRCGVARARSVPAFMEMLKLLSITGPLGGNKIASLSCSGGEASLIADRAEHRALAFPNLEPDHATAVRETLNEYVDITNPLDYHTFIWGSFDQLKATFSAMMKGNFDIALLIQDYPREDRSDAEAYETSMRAWIEAAQNTGSPAGIIATMPECMPEHVAERLYAARIVPFSGMEEALDAIEAAAGLEISEQPLLKSKTISEPFRTFDERCSKQILQQAGLSVPAARTVPCTQAADAAEEIGFPVVLKAVGSELAHKSEIGGVRLNIMNRSEAGKVAAELATLSDELLVEEMITDGVAELIVGIGRDAQFGPYLVIGSGGVYVELLNDTISLLLPSTREEIEHAVRRLKIFGVLEGYRGKPAGDVYATINAIEIIANFAIEKSDQIAELDVNPLIVRPQGHGAVAADALIRLGTKPKGMKP